MVKTRTFKYIWLCVLLLLPLTMQAQVMDTDKKTDAPSKIERKSSSVMSASQVENSKKVGGAKKRSFEPVNQMVPVEKTGVDTLSLLDRIALRTNTVDWALLIPNFGAEFESRILTGTVGQ